MSDETETIGVSVSETETVIMPLRDAVAEFHRLQALSVRSAIENRAFAALTLAFGTLVTGDGAARLYERLSK